MLEEIFHVPLKCYQMVIPLVKQENKLEKRVMTFEAYNMELVDTLKTTR
jgi:hypothetical protein